MGNPLIASDEDNPAFVNPKDPNNMVQVTFYDYAPLDKFKTESPDGGGTKHYFSEKPFVRIEIPGKPETVIERYATETDRRKWPSQWLYYEMQTGKAPAAGNIPGWKLEDWPELNPEQLRDLQFRRFYTVEQIAGASDSQAQGMGMGGPGLRLRAQEAMRLRNRTAANEMLAERDAKINSLENTIGQMLELMKSKGMELPAKAPEQEKVVPRETLTLKRGVTA